MATTVTASVLNLAEQAGSQGIAMGSIVDALEAQGHDARDVELVVWDLLAARRLTPSGFVCRTVARRGSGAERTQTRVYEFLLVPWSPALDRQLELELEP